MSVFVEVKEKRAYQVANFLSFDVLIREIVREKRDRNLFTLETSVSVTGTWISHESLKMIKGRKINARILSLIFPSFHQSFCNLTLKKTWKKIEVLEKLLSLYQSSAWEQFSMSFFSRLFNFPSETAFIRTWKSSNLLQDDNDHHKWSSREICAPTNLSCQKESREQYSEIAKGASYIYGSEVAILLPCAQLKDVLEWNCAGASSPHTTKRILHFSPPRLCPK